MLLSRYERGEVLGAGAFGVVYAGLDRVTQHKVAIKWLPGISAPARAALVRELTALRALRVPGVVQLLAEVHEQGGAAVVMELVSGVPFWSPGPVLWQTLRPTVLQTLQAVHALGLVHRDLKPENVRVQADGRPIVLDLGLATGPAALAHASRGGTRAFVAPEQLERVDVDGRADLFALGLMVYRALTGLDPFGGVRHRAHSSLTEAVKRPADPLPHGVVPDAIRRLIDALLAVDPADRPPDAESVLAVLGVTVPPLPPGDATVDGLRRHFAGTVHIVDQAGDAARAVLAASGANRAACRKTLGRWQRLGLARFEHGLWHVDLDRVRPVEPAVAALRDQVATGRSVDIDRLVALLGGAWLDGRLSSAREAVRLGLLDAEQRGTVDDRLVDWTCRLALSAEARAPVQTALGQLGRLGLDGDRDARVSLMRAWLHSIDGGAAAGLALWETVGELTDPDLETLRQGIRLHLARRQSVAAAEALLPGMWTWARGDALREANLAGWEGSVHYWQDRYAEAAACHRRAAAGGGRQGGRGPAAGVHAECRPGLLGSGRPGGGGRCGEPRTGARPASPPHPPKPCGRRVCSDRWWCAAVATTGRQSSARLGSWSVLSSAARGSWLWPPWWKPQQLGEHRILRGRPPLQIKPQRSSSRCTSPLGGPLRRPCGCRAWTAQEKRPRPS